MHWLKLIGGIVVCGLIAYCGCAFVYLGYDWGYDLVDSWLGQPSPEASNQGWMAITSTPCLVFPLFVGLYGGFAAAIWGGKRAWSNGVLCLSALSFAVARGDLPHSWPDWAAAVLWCLASIGIGQLFFEIGNKEYSFFRARIRSLPVFGCGLIAMAPAAILLLLQSLDAVHNLVYWQEAILYAVSLTASSAVAAYLLRAGDAEVGFFAGLIANGAILFANLLNISGNLMSLTLDNFQIGADLGWRALASAIAISTIAFASIGAGGFAGMCWARLRGKAG